jgi:O-antigen/teichoic acid export membrane protein
LLNNTSRLLNIGLRTSTLSARFLFIFFLAKYLDPASFGYYGLFTATVGYALYFVGLDFYTYVSREILKTPNNQRGRLLKDQAALSGILYLALIPIAIFFLNQAGWPNHLAWWFFPILLLEHFNQEMSRLLTTLSEQITASLTLFVRQGSWAIAIVALMAWNPNSRHLDSVMALWACAGAAAAAQGIWKIKQLQMGGWRVPVDWSWIKKGITISTAFLMATLALRGFQTIDRYWLEALGGIEIVGAYVLLLGVAGSMVVFLDAGIFAYTYPALIKHSHHQEHDAARAKVRQMFLQTLALSAALGAVSWLLLPYLLDWINKPTYKDALSLYPWLLLATIINAISMTPHYALYARGYDKPIIFSHLAALPAFALTTWAFSKSHSVMAIPIGLNAAFLLILFWKTFAYIKVNKSDSAQIHTLKSN